MTIAINGPGPLPPWGPSAVGDFHNVDLKLAEGIHVHVPDMRMDFYQSTPPLMPNLGQSETFIARLRNGSAVLSVPELEWVIRKALDQSSTPLSDFQLKAYNGNRIECRLTYNYGPISIPFTVQGTVQMSTDHRLLFKPVTYSAGALTFLLPVFRGAINDALRPLGIHMGEDWATLDPVQMLGMLGNKNLAGLENINQVATGDGYLALGVGLGSPNFALGLRPGDNYLHLQGQGIALDGIALYGADLVARDPAHPDLQVGDTALPPGLALDFRRIQGLAITDRQIGELIGSGSDTGSALKNIQVVTLPDGLWIGTTLKGQQVSLAGPVQVSPAGRLLLSPLSLTYGPFRLKGHLAAMLAGRLVSGLQPYGDGLAFDLKQMLGLNLPRLVQVTPTLGRLYLRFAGDGTSPPPAAIR